MILSKRGISNTVIAALLVIAILMGIIGTITVMDGFSLTGSTGVIKLDIAGEEPASSSAAIGITVQKPNQELK